jgi:hypothetical protein
VDLWDLTKMLWRRWYAAVPLLLVSLTLVLLSTKSVKPDYDASGHVLLIPAATTVTDPSKPVKLGKVHNPWEDLGLLALGQAAVIKIQDQKSLDALAEQGMTPNVTLTVSYPTPLVSIEAVGTTPAQATRTVQYIMKLIDQEVAASQRQYGVATEDLITTLPLDKGDNVKVITSKVKRVVVVAAGTGLLVTAAGTITLDVLLRRRTRKRLVRAAAEAGGSAEGSTADAPAPEGDGETRELSAAMRQAAAKHAAGPGRQGRAARAADAEKSAQRPVVVEYQPGEDRRPAETAEPARPNVPTDPSEVTIILPRLSEATLTVGEEKSGRR